MFIPRKKLYKGCFEYNHTGTKIVTWVSQEESPSCCKTVFHLTNGRSDTRESATEIRLLVLAQVKVKRCV